MAREHQTVSPLPFAILLLPPFPGASPLPIHSRKQRSTPVSLVMDSHSSANNRGARLIKEDIMTNRGVVTRRVGGDGCHSSYCDYLDRNETSGFSAD